MVQTEVEELHSELSEAIAEQLALSKFSLFFTVRLFMPEPIWFCSVLPLEKKLKVGRARFRRV